MDGAGLRGVFLGSRRPSDRLHHGSAGVPDARLHRGLPRAGRAGAGRVQDTLRSQPLPAKMYGPGTSRTVLATRSGTSRTLCLLRSGSDVEGLLRLSLWGCGHRGRSFATGTGGWRDVHKSTGCGGSRAKIDGADCMGAKMNAEDAVLGGRTKRDPLAAKRLAEANATVPEADVARPVHLAHDVASSVFDRRQTLRERPIAWPITLTRNCHVDRLMRPVVVVAVPPAVEGALALIEVGQAVECD